MKSSYKRTAGLLVASGIAFGSAANFKARAEEVLAYTGNGVIESPEIASSDNPVDASAEYVETTVIQSRLSPSLSFYELKAVFLQVLPAGKCLLTYHAIPSLQRAIDHNPTSDVAREASEAIADLKKLERIYTNNPDQIAHRNWGPIIRIRDCSPLVA